eukprot:TRINITY_DN3590_c1_g2_i2.p1 TRINITY_DN3590_c1_g2~~TRINITY_DN3590_c1_g2_i2.p1  ORF type:complete len:216 (-),score=41.79 TRINITY_DN3590_c1_g2_i2:17-664(-)
MSNITVVGIPLSTCTRRVLTVLEETGTSYTLKPVDFAKGEHKSPEYIAKEQPFGQIPVLHDGSFKLYESRAIIRYLAAKYDKTKTLLPQDPESLGLVEQFISVESSNYKADEIVYEKVFKKWRGGEADQAIVDAAFAKVARVYEVLEEHLKNKSGNKGFLVGDHLTLADVVYLPYTGYLLDIEEFKHALDKYPHVHAWWKNVTNRPSWQKVISLK